MEEKLNIDKLDESNYSIWKFKLKLFLMQKECWRAVDPGTDQNDASNQKALAIIGLAVKDDQIVHIQSAETAKEACDSLKKVYEDTGTASKVLLQDQLMTTKL